MSNFNTEFHRVNYHRVTRSFLFLLAVLSLSFAAVAQEEVIKFTDVCYVSIPNPHARQVLDLTLPGSGNGPFPLLIFIHGGAFMAGNKADVNGTAFNEAPGRGYALAGINYRLASANDTVGRFPQGIQDVMAAIRYLRANAEKYHLDPNRFAVAGFSSGGYHTAMICVLSGAENDIEDFTLGNPGVSSAVQAAVSWSGLSDLLKLDEQQAENPDVKYWISDHSANPPEAIYIGGQITSPAYAATFARSNPLNYVTVNTPPILMQHAPNDNIVPWQQSQILVNKINEVAGSGRAIFDAIDNGGHGGAPFNSISNSDRIFQFLNENLINKTESGVSTSREQVPESIKKEALIQDDGKSLAIPELKTGDAIVKGKFIGYVPEMNWKVKMFVNNPVTNCTEELETNIRDDGSFELKVPLVTTMQVLLRINPFYNKDILLSPGKETTLYVDLYQKNCQETENEALKCPAGKYMYFGGANAEINNQMEDKNIDGLISDLYEYTSDYNAILNMSAEQYKAYILDKMNKIIDKLSQKGLTKKACEFAVMEIHFKTIYLLIFADNYLAGAYRKAHNLDYKDKMVGYTEPVFDKAFYSFLKEIPFNNQISLYNDYFRFNVNNCKYLKKEGIHVYFPTKALYQKIIDSGKLSQKEKEYAKYLQAQTYDNWSAEKQQDYKTKAIEVAQKLIQSGELDSKTLNWANKYLDSCADPNTDIFSVLKNEFITFRYVIEHEIFPREVIESIFSPVNLIKYKNENTAEPNYSDELKQSFNVKFDEISNLNNKKEDIRETKSYLADILGTSQGIVFDMVTAQFYCDNKFDENVPLTADELKEIAQIKNPFYFNYINRKNNELLAQIEMNKGKKGYTIYDVPETEEDSLFTEILKPFAGKVILVDFWATWCGPCRVAMKQFEFTKERLKDKGVVFVYLTDESSPLVAWQNMLPNIQGEHFRLKKDQFDYLKKKFRARGVPAYLILNKAGEQIYFTVGFPGAESLEKRLTDALSN